jgi:hypothetical protein
MEDLARYFVSSAAEGIRIARAPNGGVDLIFANGKSFSNIKIVCAAPLSQRRRYICFLDSAGEEICMIRDLSELAAEDRPLAEKELRIRYITTVIRRVFSMRCEAGTLYLQTDTERGLRELIVQNSDENVRWLTDYCVLLIDADGSRFEIPDIRVLGQRMARMITENLQ